MARAPVSEHVQTNVLLRSRRRCCICFGLDRDANVKAGQIAHLDRDHSNAAEDNLAFLCLVHHDEYDSKTRQRKGLTIREVKTFREELYAAMRRMEQSDEIALEASVVARGGRGGSGEIFGSGKVIGGRGGRVGVGGHGAGGDGGGGLVHGDGVVIGGDGGSVDGADVWFPPARSGYDHFIAEQGETPDWGVMYPGYGGMSAGYLERHRIVQAIRSRYFESHGTPEKIERSKIGDVPIDHINAELQAAGFAWRAEQEGHWYLFHVVRAEL